MPYEYDTAQLLETPYLKVTLIIIVQFNKGYMGRDHVFAKKKYFWLQFDICIVLIGTFHMWSRDRSERQRVSDNFNHHKEPNMNVVSVHLRAPPAREILHIFIKS